MTELARHFTRDVPGPRRDFVGYGRHAAEGRLARRRAASPSASSSTTRRARSTRCPPATAERGPRRDPVPRCPASTATSAPSRSTSTAAAPASGGCCASSTSTTSTSTFFAAAVALERNPEVGAVDPRGAATSPAATAGAGRSTGCSTRDEEREQIQRGDRLDRADAAASARVGWYCRYGPSVNTRELLVEEGGFLYDSDAYNDDLPYFTEVQRHAPPGRALHARLQRRRFVLPQGFGSPSDFFEIVQARARRAAARGRAPAIRR